MLSGEEFVFVLPRFVMLEKNCDNICGFQDLWVTLPFTMFVFVSFSMVARSDVSCFFKIVYVAKSTMTTTTILDWRASIKLRWRQRRRRIKGVNCKQHFLAAPVIHLLIDPLIDPLIDSLIDSFIEWFIDWFIYWMIHSFMFMAVPLQKEEFRFASKHRWRQGRGEMKIFIITLCAATVCFA